MSKTALEQAGVEIADAIGSTFISHAVCDCEGGPANVVDVGHSIAGAINNHAKATELIGQAIGLHAEQMLRLAQAVESLVSVARNEGTPSCGKTA